MLIIRDLNSAIRSRRGVTVPGSKGLSLFYVETRSPESSRLNGIQINRLKEKLGTRQLPTGELTLDGAIARMVDAQLIVRRLMFIRLFVLVGSIEFDTIVK